MDTIFALASAPGRAGVAVLRVSGPQSQHLCRSLAGTVPEPRCAKIAVLRSADGVLDKALVLFFEGPASFTGEDIVEFHLHGGPAVVQSVISFLSTFEGCRLAEPGEFTRRALENGKLDLTEIEGLADLIDAETEAQRRQAQSLFEGRLGEAVEVWRRDAIRAAALLEATIDFADEEVPEDVSVEVLDLLGKLTESLTKEVEGSNVAERVRHGFEIAIIGAPNVGKSTLLNALAGRDAAITSSIAGTTRDVIEVRMDLRSLPVTVLDTAGLRETADEIEQIGVKRALARAESADVRVFLAEPDEQFDVTPMPDDIWLRPKADLLETDVPAVSGKTGQGVDELIDRLHGVLSARVAGVGFAVRERHGAAMSKALGYIAEAAVLVRAGPDSYDRAAEEIRSAQRSLEVLLGRIDVEGLLDEIFSSFCLGK